MMIRSALRAQPVRIERTVVSSVQLHIVRRLLLPSIRQCLSRRSQLCGTDSRLCQPSRMAPPWLVHLHVSLLVFCAGWAAFLPVLEHHAVYDDVYVLGSPDLHSTWAEWLHAGVSNDVWGSRLNSLTSTQQWRPVGVASLRASLHLRPPCRSLGASGGPLLLQTRDSCDAPPHACLRALHTDTLLLHCLCGVLLYAVAAGALRRRLAHAALAALLYALHPVHTESVATVYGRADVLALDFHLLALLCAWRGLGAGTRPMPGFLLCTLSLALSVAAALSKENGLLASLAIPLADALLWRSAPPLRRLLFAAASLGLVAAALLARRALIVPWGPPTGFVDNPTAFLADRWARCASFAWLLMRYAEALVLPWRQAINHGWDSGTLIVPPIWGDDRTRAAAAAAVAGVGLLGRLALGARGCWALDRGLAFEGALPLFLALWAGLLFLPASNLVFVVGTTVGERLLYLPSAPACLLAVAAWARLLRASWGVGDGTLALALPLALPPLLLALAAYRCRAEAAVYHCEERLWRSNAQRYPSNVLAINNLAVRFDTVGRHAAALPLYDTLEALWAAAEKRETARPQFVGQEGAWSVAGNAMRRSALGRARVLRPVLRAAAADAAFEGGEESQAMREEGAATTAIAGYVEALNGSPDLVLGARILERMMALCGRWDADKALPVCNSAREMKQRAAV